MVKFNGPWEVVSTILFLKLIFVKEACVSKVI
jgi:hypothetical protein